MKELDDLMRSALSRDEESLQPPPDFAAKVLAKTVGLRKTKVIAMPLWRKPAAWALAAGLSIAAIVPPSAMEYQRRREARALEARRELFIALELTRVKLRQTKERIQRTTRHTL
jgi:hypothetical protein